MPLFRATLTINRELLDRLHALPERARRNIYTTARTQMVPDLEKDANELMDPGPSPVSSPFEFGGEGLQEDRPSRKYWFMLVSTGQVETDGEHYIRSGDIEHAFKVEAAGNISESLFRVFNAHQKAKYVLGPWIVQGHLNSGWAVQVQTARQLLREKANLTLRGLWYSAIYGAWKGVDQ